MKYTLFLLTLLLTAACGDDALAPSQQPDPIEPEVQQLYDELGIEPVYDPDRPVRRDRAPGHVDGEEPEIQDLGDPSDKARISPLQGWALEPVLAYQDGALQSIGGRIYADFCQFTPGAVCDNEWHAQAKNTDFGPTGTNSETMITGLCGVGSSRHWDPCVLPNMYRTGNPLEHVVTWRLNRSTCPTALLPRLDAGIALAHALLYNAYVKMVKVSAPANVEYKCENLGNDTLGDWAPTGKITPRWGAPVDGGEVCTESGFVPTSYIQKSDLIYTYDTSMIRFNPIEISQNAGACGMNAAQINNSVANLVTHELGHLFGFTHQLYSDPLYNVMNEFNTCPEDKTLQGFHPFMKDAIRELDTRLGERLQVVSRQISCFSPSYL